MSHSSTASSVTDGEGPAYVQFRSPDNTYIRFTEADGCLLESVCRNGGWKDMGVAKRLYYDAAVRHLSDERGLGGILPVHEAEDILRRLVKVADLAGVPHNIRIGDVQGDLSVVFKAPSGDVVRFVATLHDGVEEYVRSPNGDWTLVGFATHFNYNPATRALLDQNGRGGVLPGGDLTSLLTSIKKLAESANITHNIRSEPAYRPSGTGHRRGIESNISQLFSPRTQNTHRGQGLRSPYHTCKALLVTCSNGFDNAQACNDRIKLLLGKRYPNVQCYELSNMPSREELLRGLEWLVAGTEQGDAVLISILGMADPYTGLSVAGGFSQHDWRSYLSTLPQGLQVTILCETHPAVDVVGLPYRVTVNAFDDGYFCSDDDAVLGTEARVTMVCTEASELRKGGLGVLVEGVLGCLEVEPEPTYAQLLGYVKRRILERGSMHLRASVTSNMVFDAAKERFLLCHTGAAPLDTSYGAQDYSDYDGQSLVSGEQVPLSSLHSSELDEVIHGTPLNTDNEVREALFFVYSRVNPNKLHLVERFVRDYKGQYRNLFELISKKYGDPTILDSYSPFWGP